MKSSVADHRPSYEIEIENREASRVRLGLLDGRNSEELTAQIRECITIAIKRRKAGPALITVDMCGGDMGRGCIYRDAVNSGDYDGVLSLECHGDSMGIFGEAVLDALKVDPSLYAYTVDQVNVFTVYGVSGGATYSAMAYVLFPKRP